MSYGAEEITRKQNFVIKKMEQSEINSLESAKSLEELPFFENGKLKYKRTFNNLVKQGVIRKNDNKYFLDVERSKNFKKGFKRFFLI